MLTLKDAIAPAEVKQALAVLKGAAFVDGKASALGDAREAKSNLEAAHTAPDVQGLQDRVRALLAAHPALGSYARPVKWSQIIFSRYENGAEYGPHTDSPFMATADGGEMRADLSFTLFLSEPASYNGGELVMMPFGSEDRVRLAAGSLVVYPTTLLHRVTPVTRGARYAAIGWIESRVADDQKRLMLCEMEQIIAGLPADARRRGLMNIYANLTKMWSV